MIMTLLRMILSEVETSKIKTNLGQNQTILGQNQTQYQTLFKKVHKVHCLANNLNPYKKSTCDESQVLC